MLFISIGGNIIAFVDVIPGNSVDGLEEKGILNWISFIHDDLFVLCTIFDTFTWVTSGLALIMQEKVKLNCPNSTSTRRLQKNFGRSLNEKKAIKKCN